MGSQLSVLASSSSSSRLATQTYHGSIVKMVDQNFLNFYGIRPKDRHAKIKKSVVQGLYYCRSEIDFSGVGSSASSAGNPQDCLGLPPLRGGINHDFLVIEFRLEGFSESFFLRAEKVADIGIMSAGSRRDCAIRIDLLPPSTSLKRNIFFEVHSPVQIDLEEVIAALEDQRPDYNLVNHNCWSYAVEAGQDVLNTLANADDASPRVKERYSLDLSATIQEMIEEELATNSSAGTKQILIGLWRKFTGKSQF